MPATIKVEIGDIRTGRAYMTYSDEAKINIAHRAGAPWNHKAPDAELHDLQQEVIKRPERVKIVHGASRLGKSVLGGIEAMCEILCPNTKTAVVAARYDHVKAEWQYVDQGLKNLFGNHMGLFKVFKYKATIPYAYAIESLWGSTANGYTTDSDDGAALLGQEFSRVVLGEGSHISKWIYEHRIARAVDGFLMQSKQGFNRPGGYVSIYTTPKEYEGCSAELYEYVMRETRNEPDKLHLGEVSFPESIWIREANILENPYFDRKVYEARKATLSKEAFDEQYRGKMIYKTGRIYKEFSDADHVVPMPFPNLIREMRLCLGIDTGQYYGASLVGMDRSGLIWNLGETYTKQLTIYESIKQTKGMVEAVLGPAFEEQGFEALKPYLHQIVVDPASQHKREIFAEGVVCASPISPEGVDGNLELEPTIDAIRKHFAANMVRIVETSTYTIDQLNKYVYKQQKAASAAAVKAPVIQVPKKVYDHLCDSFRFAALTVMAMGPLPEPQRPASWQEAHKTHIQDRLHGELKRELARAGRRPRRRRFAY